MNNNNNHKKKLKHFLNKDAIFVILNLKFFSGIIH